MRRGLNLSIMLLMLMLSVGVMGQKERYLQEPLPATWSVEDSTLWQENPINEDWWKRFNDTTLDSLIAIALEQNYSVLMAIDRINMAKASYRSAQGGYYPTFALNVEWLREQTSGHISSTPQMTMQYGTGTVNMKWELDLFGRITNQVREQKAAYQVSQADYNAVLVSLFAEVATAYFGAPAIFRG